MKQYLEAEGLKIIKAEGKYIDLAHGYRIELEKEDLYKLTHEGSVIAPFNDREELLHFLKMDMELNGLV